MSDNSIRCGLDGCISQQCASLGSHVWEGKIAVYGCLPTAIPQRTRYISIWVDLDDRERRLDEFMLGLYTDPDGEDGVEAWLTAADVERVYYLLGSAIRRHTAYGQIAP